MIVGVDIGGTFTDFVVLDRELRTFKLPSDPNAPEAAVLRGLERIGIAAGDQVIHGSTVATNAVLERRGARTAFIATEGFADLLSIGRQNRSQLYDLHPSRPEPLVPQELCFEVQERLDRHGHPLIALDPELLSDLVTLIQQQGVESVSVCLLFSFLNPQHEQQLAQALHPTGVPVSLSSEVLPEFREYERASTTTLNAYVSPVMGSYLDRLEAGVGPAQLRIMLSNGGSLSASQASQHPARAILSGPAGGVVGALAVARAAGFEQVITFDMGGTSTDVSLANDKPNLTSEGEIDGLPLRLPMIDIHTVGAGGGSIARVDAGGSLRVGPQSAGAEPGPACYGRGGTEATVTDANLVLGRIDPERFLGGEFELDDQAAHAALDRLAGSLGFLPGAERARRAALGVIQIANAHMARALRVVSVSQGHDPRGFTLVSFGGAGGLHACELARSVGIRQVLVPPMASTLSAYGMTVADVKRDFVRTVMLDQSTPYAQLTALAGEIEQLGRAAIKQEGVPAEQVEVIHQLDLRYAGQAYEITLPLDREWQQQFHEAHQREYGYSDRALAVQVVNLRVQVIGRVAPPLATVPTPDPGLGKPAIASVFLGDDPDHASQVPAYDGWSLSPQTELDGPALITYPDTTVLLGDADHLRVDPQHNLVIEVSSA